MDFSSERYLPESRSLYYKMPDFIEILPSNFMCCIFDVHCPSENSKPLQVMRYGLEEAKENTDYFGKKSALGLSQPLMATVVLYLSNVTQGGELLFPNSEVRETCIIFLSYHNEGKVQIYLCSTDVQIGLRKRIRCGLIVQKQAMP